KDTTRHEFGLCPPLSVSPAEKDEDELGGSRRDLFFRSSLSLSRLRRSVNPVPGSILGSFLSRSSCPRRNYRVCFWNLWLQLAMAMQSGIGLTKVLILTLLKGFDKSGESSNAESDYSEALASQVRRLAMEVRHLASARQITVVNGDSGQMGNVASLLVPAAALGALGYGYMKWKGLSFSDLMYVTKRNMANAVTSMTKHLEQVSSALAATKRHLTQRIENLDGKLDEQKDLTKLLKSEDFANAGVWYLCQFVGGTKDGKMPEFLQGQAKPPKRLLGFSDIPSAKGLQYIADTIKSGTVEKSKTNAVFQTGLLPSDVDFYSYYDKGAAGRE
ncbi:hypothetical protein EJ110_NYTH40626, partial [Nymphaea thermarum]